MLGQRAQRADSVCLLGPLSEHRQLEADSCNSEEKLQQDAVFLHSVAPYRGITKSNASSWGNEVWEILWRDFLASATVAMFPGQPASWLRVRLGLLSVPAWSFET